ncbi:MAG: hypothetical protein VYA08_02260, partial [Pseudomonadota bacterium]|nr:hypothetical protein [Pseudomonadota bacterium]
RLKSGDLAHLNSLFANLYAFRRNPGLGSFWVLQAGVMGGSGSVGTVSLNSFYRGTNDTSSPYDLIINFTVQMAAIASIPCD